MPRSNLPVLGRHQQHPTEPDDSHPYSYRNHIWTGVVYPGVGHRLAADQGLAMAQCNLGSAYMNGDGVTQDDAEAARWYHLAAEQGVQLAKALLGQLAAGAPGSASTVARFHSEIKFAR